MNKTLDAILAKWAEGRWMWAIAGRRRRLTERAPGWMWLIPAAAGLLALGLPILILSRLAFGSWSFWSFWVPGSAGLVAGALAGLMMFSAWNRRAAALAQRAAAGEPVERPKLTFAQAWVVQPLLLLFVFITGVMVATGLENLRGARAVAKFRNELRAQGEPVVLEEVIPRPVPDDQNLALTPLLRPLFELAGPRQSGVSEPPYRDPAAVARLKAITPGRGSQADWMQGTRVKLDEWQAFYAGQKDWPKPESPQSAARDVLTALSRFDAELKELREAAATRPEALFPISYEEGFFALLPHLGPIRGVAGVLRLRAVALLAEQRPDEALADILLILRLSDAVAHEPLLISRLVRIAMDSIAMQPIWEGLLDRRWNESQLATLQKALESRDHLKEMAQALRGERVISDTAFDDLMRGRLSEDAQPGGTFGLFRFLNAGWVNQNRVAYGRYVMRAQRDLLAAKSLREFDAMRPPDEVAFNGRSIFTILAAMLAPALDKSGLKAFEAEATRRLAIAAIALERHRLGTGDYPSELEALAPAYLAAHDLLDPMTGEPLKYQRLSADNYQLYSVGTDFRDDSGLRPEVRSQGPSDRKAPGDIVWR
jgi:hypothetical protein